MPDACAAGEVPPRIGVTLWRVGRQDSSALAAVAACGVRYIHLDLGGPGRGPDLTDPAHLEPLRRTMLRLRMTAGALSMNRFNDIGLPDGDAARLRSAFDAGLRAARRLGAPRLIVPGFGRSLIRSKADFEAAARRLAAMADLAARSGLELVHEPSLGAAASLRLAKAVGADNFTLLFDSGNPARLGECPARVWTAIRGRACADAHLKDVGPRGGPAPPLACGRAGLAATMRAFARAGRPRNLVLEGDYRRDPVQRIRRDLAALRRLLRSA